MFGKKKKQGDGPSVEFIHGDLTKSGFEAIVNAANSSLVNGAGVAGAVFTAAGAAELAKLCAPLAPCPTGKAVITGSGRLSGSGTKYIIHAVGPIWHSYTPEKNDELLASAYRNALALADENGIKEIAFPSISTGVYGFPPDRAARIVAQVIREYRGNVKRIVLMDIEQDKLAMYRQAYQAG